MTLLKLFLSSISLFLESLKHFVCKQFWYLLKRVLTLSFKFIYLFIYGCVGSSPLCEGFLQLWQAGATPHRGVRASHHRGLSCCGAQALRRTGSVIVAHGASRSAACGIFPDQGSNPCPLHWQADSQPLRHQGSPTLSFKRYGYYFFILLYCID